MESYDSLERFVQWVQGLNTLVLCNEDDVESKFVLPFFKLLGYPDSYRRGKFPLPAYSPGKKGRKPEVDQIYFSTDEVDKQNENTSLLIVEAKEPDKRNLEEDIDQANFYAQYLKVPIVVVTNGYRLIVQKRQQFREDETIFDICLNELQDCETATEFYKRMRFDVVKVYKSYSSGIETYVQFEQLYSAIQRHPDLQVILNRGDFHPRKEHSRSHIVIVQPKVAIACQFPIAFGEGSCQIQFSSITLQGLNIHLTHRDILGQLMTGLETPPSLQTRRFLERVGDNAYKAELGDVTVILQEDEVDELCDCIDQVCCEYKHSIVETETCLETWEFEPMEIEGIHGFHLFTVRLWLWKLMHKFAREVGAGKCTWGWRILEPTNTYIQINSRDDLNYITIYPVPVINSMALSQTESVHLLYVVPNFNVEFEESIMRSPWSQGVGSRGLWTAAYAKKWLLETLIPKVCAHYTEKYEAFLQDLVRGIDVGEHLGYLDIDNGYQPECPILKDIDDPNQFSTYLHAVQAWLHLYGMCISALVLRPYYAAFTQLIQDADFSVLRNEMNYIAGNLKAVADMVGINALKNAVLRNARQEELQQYILVNLNAQVDRINRSDYEDSHCADLISRVFIAVVENGGIHNCTQEKFNAAKQALLPLWEQQRFEDRYISF